MTQSSWKGRTVLVTGAEGFIGSHLVAELLNLGARVRAFVRYDPQGGTGWLNPESSDIEFVAGDIRDQQRVATACSGATVVFHLAALVGIPYSYLAPESYVQTNTTGTLNILQGARGAGVESVILTSTSEVYGTALSVPIDEAHPLRPQSPYAASKVSADMLGLSFYHSFGLPVSIVRPFNAFGPRQSTRAVIPTILAQILAGNEEIALGSVTPTRDFTFVSDTARAFVAAAAEPSSTGRALNVGTGREISIGSLVELLAKTCDREVVITTDQQRVRPESSEVNRLVCNSDELRRLTGWEPQVSLEDGLKRTATWVSANLATLNGQGYRV